ncbi:unnamed protein product [Schistosoma curassoni]|uniref:Ig-like domain-containing protein n=1 Tax=Schistosoma curassoni TaxID=6186 RepID=A0A183KB24_9TREM|nr:unnamed protein product [Schistosoma curassoni]
MIISTDIYYYDTTTQTSQLIPIPIRNTAVIDKSGNFPNVITSSDQNSLNEALALGNTASAVSIKAAIQDKWELTRRLFMVDNFSGKTSTISKVPQLVRYASNIEIKVTSQDSVTDGQIYPPIIKIDYSNLYATNDYGKGKQVQITFSVTYSSSIAKQAAFDQALRIAMGCMSTLAACYAMIRTWIWSRRAGVLRLDAMLVIKLILFAAGNISNAFLIVIYFVSIYFLIFYKIDGHNLEQAIYAIIKPDCLSPNAENLSKISSTYPQVLWLIQYLDAQLNLIKESQEELDMLMLNMQVGSASPVDLSELVTKSRNNNNNINDQRYNDKKSLTKRSSSPLFSDENSSVGHSNNVNATFKSIPLIHHSFPNNINSDKSVTQMNSNNNFNEINSAPPILCSTWRIVKPLSNIQCKLGDIIKLQCYFNGPSSRDAFSVLWFYRPFKLIKGQLSYGLKERINLTCSNDIVENIKIDFVELMIKNVTAYRAGLYTIRIRNEETGKAMKSNASLTIIPNILEDKPDLEIETLDTSTGLLKPITIEVGYEGLCIIPDVKWTYNGSPINRSIWRIDTDMNRSILYSANAHISDKGVYECEIRDHVTNTILKTRRSIQIQPSVPVNEQPLVFGNNQTVGMVFVGDPVVIRCPLPSVIKTGSIISVDWLHDKQKIYSMKTTVPKQSVNKVISSRLANFEGNQFQRGETIWRTYLMDNHCVLTTDNVQNTDEGIYRCRIKSDTGIYESSGSLSLVKAVHFSRGLPTLLDISKGDRTKLTCCLEILPFKDNKITDSINNNNNRTSINQNVSPTSSVPLLSPLPMNQWDQLSLQINWFLNNELLDTEKAKKLNINTNFVNGLATLSIDSVSTEHEGDYCCKVESSKGIIQTYGKIILKSE